MPRPLQITSAGNPRVKQVVRLREQRERRRTGRFIAEGRRELARALAAGLTVREVYVCPELLGVEDADVSAVLASLSLDAAEAPEAAVALGSAARVVVTPAVLGKMAYLREPEGLLAVVDQRRWNWSDLPPVGPTTLVLVAVGIEKPGNLGAMVRTAEAAGCAAVVSAGAPVDIYNPNTIRTSTGAVFDLPVIAADEHEAIEALHARGLRLVATAPTGERVHTRSDLTGPVAIVIGPEDRGLNERWFNAARDSGGAVVRIPMRGQLVDSLNASTAAAVVLFEALRQRDAAAGDENPL